MLDTDVAIHLRDGGIDIRARVAALAAPPAISLITLVELRGGSTARADQGRRRERLEVLLSTLEVVGFDEAVVDAYAAIIDQIGFVRSRVLDRLIAATAIVHDATFITINGTHFRDIPDLKLEVWPSPTQ